MVSKGQFLGLDWNRITRLHSQVMTGTHELTNSITLSHFKMQPTNLQSVYIKDETATTCDSAMLLVSSCVPLITWLYKLANWPLLTIEFPVSQWIGHPTRSRRFVGSNPIWNSEFSLHLISCCCFILNKLTLLLLVYLQFYKQIYKHYIN